MEAALYRNTNYSVNHGPPLGSNGKQQVSEDKGLNWQNSDSATPIL